MNNTTKTKIVYHIKLIFVLIIYSLITIILMEDIGIVLSFVVGTLSMLGLIKLLIIERK